MAHAQKRSIQPQARPWWLTGTLIGYLAGKSLSGGWRAKYSPYLAAQKNTSGNIINGQYFRYIDIFHAVRRYVGL